MQKVYIVVPMYNAKKQIDNAINSVLTQKNIDVSLVLVDHGSNDRTFEYVYSKYGKHKKIALIGLERIPDEVRSASRPLNNGMRYVAEHAANSAWVMRLDADDVLADDCTIFKILQSYKDGCVLIGGSMLFINTQNRTAQEYCQASKYSSVRELRRGAAYAYPHHSMLVSVKMLKKVLYKDGYCYFEKIGYGEDLDYTLRMLALCRENRMCFSKVPMIIKELSGDTITNSVNFRTLMYDHYVIFNRNRCMSKILYLKIILWYLLDNMGMIGKAINSKRKPPAGKYTVSNTLDFETVYKMKEKWKSYED